MKLPTPRIWKIEKEILDLKRKLLEDENEAFDRFSKSKIDLSDMESAIRIVVADRKLEIDVLDLERKFLLDRQNNLFWRIVWNIIVPVLITIATTWIIVEFGLR